MGKKQKQIYLHIGLPKSGSTSVQSFLGLNRQRLSSLGYDVFPTRALHDDVCACLLAEKISRDKNRFESSACRPVWNHFERAYKNTKKNLKMMQDEILDFVQTSEYDRLIFSCEHLSSFIDFPYFPLEKTVAGEIGGIFSRFDKVTVVCVFRNQLDFLVSLYKNWVSLGYPIAPEAFLDEMMDHCDWLNIYKNFRKILPNATFKGVLFEDYAQSGLQGAVLKEMGVEVLPDDGWQLANSRRNIGVPSALLHMMPSLCNMFAPHEIQYLFRKVRRFSETFYQNRKKHVDTESIFNHSHKRTICDQLHASNNELLNILGLKDAIPKWEKRFSVIDGDGKIERTGRVCSDAIELIGTYFMELCERHDNEDLPLEVPQEVKDLAQRFLAEIYPYDKKVALYGGGHNSRFLLDALKKNRGEIQVPPAVIDDWPGVSYLHSTHISEVENAKSFNYDSVDFVIISSLKNESRMLEKLNHKGVERKKILVLRDDNSGRIDMERSEDIAEATLLKKLQDKNLEAVIEHIGLRYNRKPTLMDGYSKLGNIYRMKKRYDIALDLFEKDRISNRMTPVYRQILAYILAKTNANEEAIEEINHAYLADPTLSDGYNLIDSKSGRQTFCDDDVNDLKHGSDDKGRAVEHLMELSLFHAQNEDLEKAATLVSTAYKKDDGLLDGYAGIGEILSAFAQFEKALVFYKKDYNLGRLSPQKKISYAKLLAHFSRVNEAEKEVSCAYAENRLVRDGFATIGTVFRIRGLFDTAFDYFDKDRLLDRISPKQRHILADQLARKGRLNDATKQVERGYRDDPSLMNGFARIGNILRVKGKKEDALRFYRLDKEQNRLTLTHSCIYAETLLENGYYQIGVGEIDEIIEKDSKFTKSRLMPTWLHKISLHLAKNGHIGSALKIGEYLYGSYADTTDLFSKIADEIHHISPLMAKKCFDKDWTAFKQSINMTEKYLKFLFENGFLDEAIAVRDEVEKNFNEEGFSKKELISFQKIKFHSRRLLAPVHSFKCPAILLSYPRSGSNFFQQIVTESSGYAGNSIYSKEGRFTPEQNILVKSHAIDLEHLKFEMQAARISFPPAKVIILFRDPHDIMRSFLEFLNFHQSLNMPPEDFLSFCSFHYAARLQDWAVGRTNNHLTVADAYRRFVDCWIDTKKWTKTDVLTVYYEYLCLKPYDAFSAISNFLGIDCTLNEVSLKQKVSLFSNENSRLRATAYAWKNKDQNPHEVYRLVDRYFKDQIKILRYGINS